MPYPEFVDVELNTVGSENCGELTHRFQLIENSSPPEYELFGTGPFSDGILAQITASGATTWQLVVQIDGLTCHGMHYLRRSTPADDPTGAFCWYSANVINCNNGTATITAV